MRLIVNVVIAVSMGMLLWAIALLSIQNVELISLKFLWWRSLRVPSGLLLATSLALGLMAGSLVPLLWIGPAPSSKKTPTRFSPGDRP